MVRKTVGRWRLTFAGVVRQDGADPHLLPLNGLTGAGLRAGGENKSLALKQAVLFVEMHVCKHIRVCMWLCA